MPGPTISTWFVLHKRNIFIHFVYSAAKPWLKLKDVVYDDIQQEDPLKHNNGCKRYELFDIMYLLIDLRNK